MSKSSLRPTIHDVAKLANVSANTVSRALNGKPNVSEKTRDRILRASKTLQYHPHLGARSLRTRPEGSIGLVFPAPSDIVPVSRNFFLTLCAELYRIFGTQGERICLDLNPYAKGGGGDYARSVWERLCSACVFAGPLATDDGTIQRVHDLGMPYLTLGRLDSVPDCSCATVDFEHGAYLSLCHLARNGHKRIGMLQGLPGYQPGVERERGYLRGLADFDLAPERRLIQPVSFHHEDVTTATYRLLNDSTVTALIDASGVEGAAAIREGARRAGRIPGKDFELLNWTYSIERALMDEATAHLWLPVREAASEGLELLGEWFHGHREEPVRVVYEPTLVATKDLAPEASPPAAGMANNLFDGNLL